LTIYLLGNQFTETGMSRFVGEDIWIDFGSQDNMTSVDPEETMSDKEE
jgi:hypothetical protein